MQIRFKKLLFLNITAISLVSPLSSADTLQEIFDLALTNDPVIRAAEATLKSGLENRTLGKSNLLPNISGRGSYSEGIGGDSDPSENTNLSVGLSQTLFDLPAWYDYKRSDALTKEAEQNYLSAKQDLIVRVTTAYFDVLRALDTMNATKSEEIAFVSQLEQTQQRYEVGLIAITDVYEAQASYDTVVANLLNAIGSVGIAFENLSVLTGREHLSIAPLSNDFPIVTPVPESSDEWVELALQNSYDLKSATFSRDASKHNATSAKLERIPTLSLGIDYSSSSSESGQGIDFRSADSEGSSISLSLNVPIYSGGSISASRRQANYQYLAEEENLNSTVRSLIQNTRNQHLTVRIDVSEVNAREKAILSSQTAYEATKAGYDVGTRNLVDLLNAEQALYQSRRDYYTARYDYIIDLFTLDQLVGGLSSSNITELEKWLVPSLSTPKNIVELSMPGMPLPQNSNEQDQSSSNTQPRVIPQANNRASGNTNSVILDNNNQTPEQVLLQWAQDWSDLNPEAYADHYINGYTANQNRIQRFAQLSNLQVSIDSIEVIEQTSRSTVIEFSQTYQSPNYSDRTQKEITLINENGLWKIQYERSLSVDIL